jgi:hypothetical protein
MLKHSSIFLKLKPRSIDLIWEEQVVKLPSLILHQRINLCWTEWIIFPMSLASWFQVPIAEAFHITFWPICFCCKFPRDLRSDVYRFSHLCFFLVHNNDLSAFISFNDPLNGEMFPCHVTCLMLAWFQKLKCLTWWWAKRCHSLPFCLLSATPTQRGVSERGSQGHNKEWDFWCQMNMTWLIFGLGQDTYMLYTLVSSAVKWS